MIEWEVYNLGRYTFGRAAVFARTAVMAMVGGFASVISGGKFLNGAVSAAFVHLFNAEAGGGRRASRHYLKKLTPKQLAKLGDFATRLKHMNVREFNKYFGTNYRSGDLMFYAARHKAFLSLSAIAIRNAGNLAGDKGSGDANATHNPLVRENKVSLMG